MPSVTLGKVCFAECPINRSRQRVRHSAKEPDSGSELSEDPILIMSCNAKAVSFISHHKLSRLQMRFMLIYTR
jgi:Fe-S-cluster-containing hydrogenase component 2